MREVKILKKEDLIMTTAELKRKLEGIERNGCQKKEVQDFRINDLEKDLNAVGKVVSEDRKATAEALTGINNKIDGMKNFAIGQLFAILLALGLLVINLIRG